MNALLITGTSIVICALASYTTAIIAQVRHKRPTLTLRVFLTTGVALDATATAFMIAGSRRIPLTFHGLLGYSAFLLMATDLFLMWRGYRRQGTGMLTAPLRRYSLAAYCWWVAAFTAGIIVAMRMT